jgi:hypothetical protein
MARIAFNHQHHGVSGRPGQGVHPGQHVQAPIKRGRKLPTHSHPRPVGVHPLGPGRESGGFDSSSENTATITPEGKVS